MNGSLPPKSGRARCGVFSRLYRCASSGRNDRSAVRCERPAKGLPPRSLALAIGLSKMGLLEKLGDRVGDFGRVRPEEESEEESEERGLRITPDGLRCKAPERHGVSGRCPPKGVRGV